MQSERHHIERISMDKNDYLSRFGNRCFFAGAFLTSSFKSFYYGDNLGAIVMGISFFIPAIGAVYDYNYLKERKEA